ncbi:unnamed protein product [Litomosoides sigmodontis]|uniref:PIH1 N-terminal domain-containing protein n=1 Tax=Litomosoides sigmodontis TaxID=42156 RepID=A0A3P6T6M8_LITSI|nr:unnamed protein product [Litomosoides sigmodontis]
MIIGNELNNVIASMSENDAWIVHPTPGYVIKFKEILFKLLKRLKLPESTNHLLLKDEVAKLLDSSDSSRYRIPLCVGDVEVVLDRKGEDSVKIDVIINSTFYLTQLEKSEFFRQLLLLVVSEAVEKKHDIKIDVKEAIKLKNRKCMGDLNAQRIRKRPQEAFIREVESVKQSEEPVREQYYLPKNCLLLLRDGRQLEVNLKFAGVEPPIENSDRLNIHMNDDHLLIILDRKQTILDIYFPMKVDYKRVEVKLLSSEGILRILVPVVW